MSVIVNPPSSPSSISVTTPSLASGISITNPNPANSVIVSPPDGGNLVTIYAGVAGPVGPQGPSNTLDVLSTTTGNPGTNANVAISGTSPNQHLAFTVPAGVSPTLSVASTVNTVVSGNNGSASLNNANPLSPTLSLTLPAGPTGPANTLSVGGTATGSAGTNAIASLSGSSPNQSLYFTIPAGVKGDTGATGSTGATGPANTLSVGGTTTGTAGTNAIASLSGTAPNQSLYFTIPAGVKGDTGASPTLSVNSTVATVPSGSQGSATLSGTATNPVLSLTLPVGQTGATGAKGDTGNTGATGATPTLSVNSTVATLGYGNNGSASIGGTLPNNPTLFLTLPAGPTGPAGSDASVTSANISSALGYTPIGDAPDDGYQYARKNLDWVEITTGNPFDQSLNTSDSVAFSSALINGSASNDSILKVGALEFQPYGVNNCWFGDNAYYSIDNGGFFFRDNGSAGLFYFQGANTGGSGEEGQFRMTGNGTAGTSFSPTTQLKIAHSGEFGVGSAISTATGDFSGANFYVDGSGNATLTGDLTAANFSGTQLILDAGLSSSDSFTAGGHTFIYDSVNSDPLFGYNSSTGVYTFSQGGSYAIQIAALCTCYGGQGTVGNYQLYIYDSSDSQINTIMLNNIFSAFIDGYARGNSFQYFTVQAGQKISVNFYLTSDGDTYGSPVYNAILLYKLP